MGGGYRKKWLFFLLLLLIWPHNGMADNVLTIPASMTVINKNLFYGNTSLTRVVLPEGLKKINEGAFAESTLEEINLPSSLEFISETAFTGSRLQTVTAEKGSYAYAWARSHGYLKEYRALLIGEKTFLRGNGTETVLRNTGDVTKMAAMLGQVYSPTGAKYSVTKKTDLGYSQVRSAIQNVFSETMDQDVSLFFIATHGLSREDGDLEMAFTGDPGDENAVSAFLANRYLGFDTLASWLTDYVHGEVIVILESCGAGSAIYEEGLLGGAGKDIAENDREEAEAFVEAAIQAFAAADGESAKGLLGATGTLRLPKYYVLAAAQHHEDSYGFSNASNDPQNLFTMWLIRGIGSAGNSPADVNPADSLLTLKELYSYVQRYDEYYISSGVVQHVQCYPQNSSYEIFFLK